MQQVSSPTRGWTWATAGGTPIKLCVCVCLCVLTSMSWNIIKPIIIVAILVKCEFNIYKIMTVKILFTGDLHSKLWWFFPSCKFFPDLCHFKICLAVVMLLLLLLSCFSRVWLCAIPQTQPTRLPCPWDSPGKNIGVGWHFLLQCMKVKSESEVSQSNS